MAMLAIARLRSPVSQRSRSRLVPARSWLLRSNTDDCSIERRIVMQLLVPKDCDLMATIFR